MDYAVSFKASAAKELARLPTSIQRRVVEKATILGSTPRPAGAVKLEGGEGLWRIRIGDYRVVYLIDDKNRVVEVRIVAHRREVYRGL